MQSLSEVSSPFPTDQNWCSVRFFPRSFQSSCRVTLGPRLIFYCVNCVSAAPPSFLRLYTDQTPVPTSQLQLFLPPKVWLRDGSERAAAVRPALIISAGWDDCLVEGKGGKNEKERPHLLPLINVNANDSHRFLICPYLHPSPFSLWHRRSTFIICRNCLFVCLFIIFVIKKKSQFLMRLCSFTCQRVILDKIDQSEATLPNGQHPFVVDQQTLCNHECELMSRAKSFMT